VRIHVHKYRGRRVAAVIVGGCVAELDAPGLADCYDAIRRRTA
jgi:hypothetical protein